MKSCIAGSSSFTCGALWVCPPSIMECQQVLSLFRSCVTRWKGYKSKLLGYLLGDNVFSIWLGVLYICLTEYESNFIFIMTLLSDWCCSAFLYISRRSSVHTTQLFPTASVKKQFLIHRVSAISESALDACCNGKQSLLLHLLYRQVSISPLSEIQFHKLRVP